MIRFTIKLAGIPIGISALHEKTRAVYREYLTTEPPLFTLEVTEKALAQERERTVPHKNFAFQNKLSPPYIETELESQWLYHQIGDRLPEYSVLLVHGSAVAVDGSAYLFTAPSGTGKSTHTRLWRQYFGERAVMINDDKPLLKFEKNTVLVCGSPWRGKHRLGTNITIPLKGVCLLTRAACNSIVTVSAEDAFLFLFRQCYCPNDPQRTAKTLTLLERLVQSVPQYRLECNTQPEAAKIAYQGMNGGIES